MNEKMRQVLQQHPPEPTDLFRLPVRSQRTVRYTDLFNDRPSSLHYALTETGIGGTADRLTDPVQ